MAAGGANSSDNNGDHLKLVRDWFDVLAKAVIAAVGVIFAFYADEYRQKTSIVTLLSQREAAESQLKSDMLQQLIGTFVGRIDEQHKLNPTRTRMLLDLMALNFHTHFELKPLLLSVDSLLKDQERDREALRSTARRVVDRQIAMLRAAGAEPERGWLPGRAAPRTGEADLFFEYSEKEFQPNVTLLAESPDAASEDRINRVRNPAAFGNDTGQRVCSVSPDKTYAIRIRVTNFDATEGTAKVTWDMTADPRKCSASDSVWRDLSGGGFSLSPYDFPLTDNAQLDPNQRFALNLYYIIEGEASKNIDGEASKKLGLHLKLVWFPPGYITERERPMNYYQVNKTLGLR